MRTRSSMLRHALVSGVLLFAAEMALALPGPATIVSGNVRLQKLGGSSLTVTAYPGAIIDWSDFSIAAADTTTFQQPTASSAVLNRVISGVPTRIYGDLRSNGGLVLINPAGFVIAPGARIDASFLTLSTLDISNEDFLAGRSNFVDQGGTGAITIEGIVTVSGALSLYTSKIIFGGSILIPSGQVVLPPVPGVNILTLPGVTGGDIVIRQGGSLTLSGGSGGVTISSAVPEPSVYAMLLAGLAALGCVARRRKA